MRSVPLLKKITSLLSGLCLMITATSACADYFVYKGRDGVTWYSDRKLPADQYTLITTVGRPSASSSCYRLSPQALRRRARVHAPFIEQLARRYKVDHLLIKAIIRVESCFDEYAVSRVGAKGLMQLMPATAQQMGVQDPFNAKENIRGGIRYFSRMLARFDNDTTLALAAYNAGPLAVEKYRGIPPYRETQSYVEKVLDHYQRYSADGP
jgi:soluble lytic murein transglycosylase-like protein